MTYDEQYRWYKNGRLIMKSYDIEGVRSFGLTQEYYDDYIGNQKHIEGDLDLRVTNITNLGKLESISGNLNLYFSKMLPSLGKLESVGGDLNLSRSTEITSLGNLKHVGGHLDLGHSQITSLGNLEHVAGHLHLDDTNITSLGKLKSVGRLIICTRDNTSYDLFMNSEFKDRVRVHR